MLILYYLLIYTMMISLIGFTYFVKLKEHYIFILFLIVYLSNAFRIDTMNDDTLNYLFYFNDVSIYNNFSDLLSSYDWVKIEIGFKALLYSISSINILNEVLIFKLVISIINLFVFYYLFILSKLKKNNNFLLFIFFYICFFLFVFDFAIIRFSISVLFLLLMFHKLIYTNYSILTIFLLALIAFSFHISALIFVFVFYYYYYIIKNKYNTFFILFPFVLVLMIVPLLSQFSSIFGSYYSNMFENTESRISIRIILELMFLFYVYFKTKYSEHNFVFKLLFVLYMFFSFVEIYLGIMVLNRLRIIVWLFFLYSITFIWKDLKLLFRFNLILYSLFFYFIQSVNILNTWK